MRALTALVLCVLLAACGIRAAEPKLDTIVISLGACSQPSCKAEQVKITSANRFAYEVYPHSETSAGTASFAETLQGLRNTGFFWVPALPSRPTSSDEDAIAVYVRGPSFQGQRFYRLGDPGYAATRAFVERVLRLVRVQAAKDREREAARDRPPAELLGIHMWHVRAAGCPYIADFKPPSSMQIRAVIPPSGRSFQPVHSAFSFERMRALAARFHLNHLYHVYPERASSNTMLEMTLTYRRGPYAIVAGEPDFWPQNLRDFVAAVDALVPEPVPGENCGLRI